MRCSFQACLCLGVLSLASIFLDTRSGGAGESLSGALSPESLQNRFKAEKWDANSPVDIRASQMQVDFNQHRIQFSGEVKVTQADFSLSAQEVTAVFGDRADDIREIRAKHDVEIRKGDKIAWGEEAVYKRQEATILLRGSPSLKQGSNYIKGDEIRVFLSEDRMDIAGGVQAEFRLKQNGNPP